MNPTAPLIFSLEADDAFAQAVAQQVGLEHGRHEETEFEDGEHKIRPLQSVRDRDVYLVQSLYGDGRQGVNEKLVRVLFFAGALRDASAARITLVAPYLCYARKDRRTQPRDPVITRYLGQLFEAMQIDRVVTFDVHNEAAFQNSLRCPGEALHAQRLFIDHFSQTLPRDRLCVASPDIGGVKRAQEFRERFSQAVGQDISHAFVEKKRSLGKVGGGTAVVGDVEGRDVIIFDDMIASGTTVARAAAAFIRQGARSVHAGATHGVFSEQSNSILATDDLSSLVITNSIPAWRLTNDRVTEKLTVLDAARLVGETISRIARGDSLADLMEA